MAEATGAIALYFAHVAADVLRPRLPSGARVLDIGDHRGRVAEHLAAAGATVVREEEGASADAGRQTARIDAAFGEVDDWGLVRARARGLESRLAPGAPLLVRMRRRPDQPLARVIADLGPGFLWESPSSLGHFVPEEAAWAEGYPQVFGLLCALEGALRSWPLLRDTGREVLLLGARRPEARATRPGEAK